MYTITGTYRVNPIFFAGAREKTDAGQKIRVSSYGFGFNGMEKDNEVKGAGNEYSADYRQYDPRLGRWTTVDQATSWLPHLSPYNGMNNNPILWVDPEGLWHRETKGKGSNKSEHLVADSKDDLKSLDKYFDKRRNRNRYTEDQKNEIRKQVEEYGKNNGVTNLDGSASYYGFDLNLTDKFNLKINMYVGVENGSGSLYDKFGGHVGVEMEGKWYHYYYKNSSDYHADRGSMSQVRHAFQTYEGLVRVNDNAADYWRMGGTHDKDVYFVIPLSIKEYNSLNRTLAAYAANPAACPNYGFFSKRCTSMANTFLTESGIKLANFNGLAKQFYTISPHAFYKFLKNRYDEHQARP